jgi:hypothetical protein
MIDKKINSEQMDNGAHKRKRLPLFPIDDCDKINQSMQSCTSLTDVREHNKKNIHRLFLLM